jgi:hypothetical protein
VDEGVDPSRCANLALSLAYKASPHSRCYPRWRSRQDLNPHHSVTVCSFRRRDRYASKLELMSGLEPLSTVYETVALPVELHQQELVPKEGIAPSTSGL